MADLRRQLFWDVFNLLDNNQNQVNQHLLHQLKDKLTALWVENERSYRICRHWKRNKQCPYGNKCKFQHFILVKSRKNCSFHQRNMCKYKDQCLFTHDKCNNPYLFSHQNNNVNQLPPIPSHIFAMAMKYNNTSSPPHAHFIPSFNSHTHPIPSSTLDADFSCKPTPKCVINNIKEVDNLSTMQVKSSTFSVSLDEMCCGHEDDLHTKDKNRKLSIQDNINPLTININQNVKLSQLSIEENINSYTIENIKNNVFDLKNIDNNHTDISDESKINLLNINKNNVSNRDFDYSDINNDFNTDNTDIDDETIDSATTDEDCFDFKLGASWCIYDLKCFGIDELVSSNFKPDMDFILNKIEASEKLDDSTLINIEGDFSLQREFNILGIGSNPFNTESLTNINNKIIIYTTNDWHFAIQLFQKPFDL